MNQNLKPILDKLDKRLMWISVSAGVLAIGAIIILSLKQSSSPIDNDQLKSSPSSATETPRSDDSELGSQATEPEPIVADKPPSVEQPAPPVVADQVPQTPPERSPPAPPPVEPEDPAWTQLTTIEQLALNPYNCPPNKDQRLTFKANGQCPESTHQALIPEASLLSFQAQEGFNFQPYPLADLQIKLQAPNCQPLTTEFENLSRQSDFSNLKAYYQQYLSHDFSFLDDLRAANQLYLIDAFSYLHNLQLYLSNYDASINDDTIYSALTKYQYCQIKFTAENIGQDLTFSDSCGLNLQDLGIAIDDQQRLYPSHYLGPEIACATVMQPFPQGAQTQTAMGFIMPTNQQIKHLILKSQANVRLLITF